jgi:hypothetical protein
VVERRHEAATASADDDLARDLGDEVDEVGG